MSNAYSLLMPRRHVVAGLCALGATTPIAAFACHQKGHCPCCGRAVVPVTGGLAEIGKEIVAGLLAMQEQLQQAAPDPRSHIAIEILDSQSIPVRAKENTLKALAEVTGALIMADASLSMKEQDELAAKSNVPFISMTTSQPDARSDWVCRLGPSQMQIAQALGRYVSAANLGASWSTNIVYNAFRSDRAEQFAAVISGSGGKVADRVVLPNEAVPDPLALATSISSAKAASIWVLSLPIPLIAPAVKAIQSKFGQRPVVIDAALGDPETILRAIDGYDVALLSSFDPELARQHPLAKALDERVQKQLQRPLTPLAALSATAVQVLAHAAVEAETKGDGSSKAVRDALRGMSLKASELILPWPGIEFDRETFQNKSARVVPLAIRDNRIVNLERRKA